MGHQSFGAQVDTCHAARLKCDEAPEEPESVASEKVLKISCNISSAVNYMQQGIMEALDGKIEEQSASLGREAVYSSTQRLSRLPTYLTVHMVRFAWKRDIGKKAKIMVRTSPRCPLQSSRLRSSRI